MINAVSPTRVRSETPGLDASLRTTQGEKMKITVTKIVRLAGKAVLFILVAAGVVLLLAERFQETSLINFMRSLM